MSMNYRVCERERERNDLCWLVSLGCWIWKHSATCFEAIIMWHERGWQDAPLCHYNGRLRLCSLGVCLHGLPLNISRWKWIWAEKYVSNQLYTCTHHFADWLKMETNCLVQIFFVSLENCCLFSVLCTASLWCLMKLLPQWHVTSEVTEGLPQWGQCAR